MGVYLSNMEMPKERESFTVTIKYNGTVLDTETGMQVAEANELQPHGRLIDADALAEKHRELAYELRGANYDFHMTARSWVNSSPTIIPAEEET